MKNRKPVKLSAQDGKLLYEGDIITDEKTKQPLYDGPGYLFNNETKCFFKGTWRSGEKVCGIETFPNGDVYEGTYKDGKFHGRGLLYNNVKLYPDQKGQYRYDGMFEYGQRHGQGKEQYLKGGYYEGNFKNNLKHGHGKLVFQDSSYYVGDFQRGLPNGFGVQVAYSKERIVAIFQIESDEKKKKKINDENDDYDNKKSEFLYEGEFVDGYKHGIGRLYQPNGSYYYAYWEYNKPTRDFIEYIAIGNKWRILNIRELQQESSINFFQIIESTKSTWEKECPIKGNSYPPYGLDGYKSLIDEKGLKRENFEDPEFDFSEQQFNIRDENGSPIAAPIDFVRLFTMDIFKQREFKLFVNEIRPGYLQHTEQYCCQQLTVVLNALTFQSYLFAKILSRKFEAEIGFYYLKLFKNNEWKEYIVDDLIPVFKNSKLPIFSNSPEQELAWVIIFKAFSKYYQSFTYFEQEHAQRAVEYLTLLTGMPTKTLIVPFDQKPNQQYKSMTPNDSKDYNEAQVKFWKTLQEKYQKTQIRICYLTRESSSRLLIAEDTAYQIVDMQEANMGKREETHYLYMLASSEKLALKTDLTDLILFDKMDVQASSAIKKMRDRNQNMLKDGKSNSSAFFISFKDFLKYFGSVVMLCASKYPVQNQQLIVPQEQDKYNFELRFFCKFSTNLPQNCLISVTQDHYEVREKMLHQSTKTFPIRIVLAKEKDQFSKKQQVKKGIVNKWSELTAQTKSKENENYQMKQTQQLYDNHEKKQFRPYKYCFGRGQSVDKTIFKDTHLEGGVYVLFIQVEIGDAKDQLDLKNMKFWVTIHSQQLTQIQQINQSKFQGFQKSIYESAVITADKKHQDPNSKIKYFHKGDLSEQENGSSDLVITQYFIKKEGTYLQHLNNKSTNKIWRQKLYYKLENMQIIDHPETQKLDICLSKKQTALVIIQQIGAKSYNLDGGEGICIVDLINEQNQEEEEVQPIPTTVQDVDPSNKKNFVSALFQTETEQKQQSKISQQQRQK